MNVNDIDFNKDYYKALGIGRDASKDDIKKAFRKMSVKWHPDKHAGDSEEDKKAAEEKFKEVNEAYSILSDDNLKAAYDQGPETSAFDMFMNPFASEANMPGEDVVVPLNVSLDNIIHGLNDKKIKYKRNVRCSHCHGDGGKTETCTHCHGTGMITDVRVFGMRKMMTQHTCPYCHGQGKFIKEPCKECNGTGFKNQEEEFSLTVLPEQLMADGAALYVGPAGSESKHPSGQNGSLIFVVQHDLPNGMSINETSHGCFSFVHKMTLPYWDIILGKNVTVDSPSGAKLSIKIPENWTEGRPLRARGKGFKTSYGTGDYIIIPVKDASMPILDKEKELLEEIKKLHENDKKDV